MNIKATLQNSSSWIISSQGFSQTLSSFDVASLFEPFAIQLRAPSIKSRWPLSSKKLNYPCPSLPAGSQHRIINCTCFVINYMSRSVWPFSRASLPIMLCVAHELEQRIKINFRNWNINLIALIVLFLDAFFFCFFIRCMSRQSRKWIVNIYSTFQWRRDGRRAVIWNNIVALHNKLYMVNRAELNSKGFSRGFSEQYLSFFRAWWTVKWSRRRQCWINFILVT